MKKLVPPDGGTQTVFISALRFIKKRLQHPQKASFGFIMSGLNRNIFMTIAIKIWTHWINTIMSRKTQGEDRDLFLQAK